VTLTFRNGHFALLDSEAERPVLDPSIWQYEGLGANVLITTNLKAAVALRRYADSSATKVFNKVLNQKCETPELPPLPFLDPHQIEGVKWILSRRRSYLAHAPGAGKTAQAIVAACLAQGSGQTVFIVPPSLTENWRREIVQFDLSDWPSMAIVPPSPKKQTMNWDADYIIVPDSMLSKSWVLEHLLKMKIKFLGVDEASRFKEPTAQRTLTLFNKLTPRAARVVLLDGSPMPNRPMELWAPVYALDPMSIDGMDQQTFGFRFCGATLNERGGWEFKHASHEEELRKRLRKTFMHVVSEDQLSHPERRRSMVFMDKDVRTPKMKTWDRKNLSKLDLSEVDEESSQGDLAKQRKELGLRKVSWIAQYVRDRLESSKESILLFVWHRSVALALANRLEKFNPGLIIGGVKHDVREKWIKDFQVGKSPLGILNISAAGRGHNLQKADRAIFGEFSWSDELNKQCEKRASRRGRDQESFVRCEYVVAPHSMDEVLLSSIFTKESRVKRIIG
jgi:SWI/SNF-related matrix-associated actin-dependent regulator 1 of chromatin subfamily A